MDATEKYFNFVRNYNEKLRVRNTEWLDPADLGAVLVQSAQQNIKKEREENEKKPCHGSQR